MTAIGLCINATYPDSRPSVREIRKLRAGRIRSITYWREDQSSWRATLAALQDYRDLGCYNLVVFNTEASGCQFKDIENRQRRLSQFLQLAQDEYGSPVHGIESDNEIDTPGWTLADDDPTLISADWAFRSASAAAHVCEDFNGRRWAAETASWETRTIDCIGPSFITGPDTPFFRAVAQSMAAKGSKLFAGVAQHYYGKSIGGQPSPGWLYGDIVEDAIDQSSRWCGDLPIHITEVGCWTKAGGMGESAQAAFVSQLCALDHPRAASIYLFNYSDAMTPDAELAEGKDWGLIDRRYFTKRAYTAFDGKLVDAPVYVPDKPEFVLGFADFAALDPALFGEPLDPHEFGPWHNLSLQRSTTGQFGWADIDGSGSRLWFLHNDGRRFRWQKDWPTYQQVTWDKRPGQ